MKRLITVLAFFIFHHAVAQKIRATIDRNDILIGEQIQLRLQANFLQGETPFWFNFDTIPRFEILQRSAIDTSNADGGFVLSQTLTITSWDSGKIQLPSLTIDPWKTDPIAVNVAYSPSPFDTAQPYHDIKDILDARRPIEEKWHWFLILALVLIGLFLLFFPKGKKKEKGVFVPDEGAYKKALRRLDQLKHSNESAGVHYTELILVFREYLHRRKNIQSFSKTTDDLGIQLQQLNLDRNDYGALLQTLRLSDLVKFAKYPATDEEKQQSVDAVRNGIIIIEQNAHAV